MADLRLLPPSSTPPPGQSALVSQIHLFRDKEGASPDLLTRLAQVFFRLLEINDLWVETSLNSLFDHHKVDPATKKNALLILADSVCTYSFSNGIDFLVYANEIIEERHELDQLSGPDFPQSPFTAKQSDRADEVSEWTLNFRKLSTGSYEVLNKLRVLNFEETKNLALAIEEGLQLSFLENHEQLDDDERRVVKASQVARDTFVIHNLRLVRFAALKMKRSYPGVDIEDLFQMGVIGLMKAVEKWDWRKGFMFSTYANWWIRQSITREAMNTENLVRIPVHQLEVIRKIRFFMSEWEEMFADDCSDSDIATHLDIDQDKVADSRNLLSGLLVQHPLHKEANRHSEYQDNIHNYIGWDGSTLEPLVEVTSNLLREQMFWVLDTLSSREQQIITLRFGFVTGKSETLDDIGKIVGVTRERIRQIEQKIMAKLRHPSRSDVLKDYLDIEPEGDPT
jgi:RNA polymerase sigma factor (sigma-70 family)